MNDHSEIIEIEKRLKNATRKLHNLIALVGHAKQVREYDSDRRKNLLCESMLPFLKAGNSAAAAETEGRANPVYQAKLQQLSEQREASERAIAEWDAALATFEAARSLLSMAKTSIQALET